MLKLWSRSPDFHPIGIRQLCTTHIQDGPYITADLYCICLSDYDTCAYADSVHIFAVMYGNARYDWLMLQPNYGITIWVKTVASYFSLPHTLRNGNHTSNITGHVESEVQEQFYPFSAYFLMLLFIILFSIIIMNLLFGLAVSDVQVRVPNLHYNPRKSFYLVYLFILMCLKHWYIKKWIPCFRNFAGSPNFINSCNR